MRVLTVCEPLASAIIFGGKTIENRKRSIGAPGVLLIQAGKSIKWFTPDICEWVHERWSGCPANPTAALHLFQGRLGKAIGLVHAGEALPITHDFTHEQGQWVTGPVCIPVTHPMPCTPFAVRGQQGIFILPSSSIPSDVVSKADEIIEAVDQEHRT